MSCYTSQYKQDMWLYTKLFKYMNTSGVYIELGAFHPRLLSNTYNLDKCYNWSGICIEPNINKWKYWDNSTRTCIFDKHCIGSRDNVDVLFEARGDSGIAGININKHDNKHKRDFFTTKCITLTTLLKKHNIYHIDFLSLDVEGFEANVLNGINFNIINIDIILMEYSFRQAMFKSGIVYNKHDPVNILVRNGYMLIRGVGYRGWKEPIDTLWIHTESKWWTNCRWILDKTIHGTYYYPLYCKF